MHSERFSNRSGRVLVFLALADSIRTPDIQSKARVESAKILMSRGDSAETRRFLKQILAGQFDSLDAYYRFQTMFLLARLNLDSLIIARARSKVDLASRAAALIEVAGWLSQRVPRTEADRRRFAISNGGDSCRERF